MKAAAVAGEVMMHSPLMLEDIQAAQARLAGHIVRTPLVRLNVEPSPAEIYLKLENLQPIGAFKIRGAVNAMQKADEALLAKGVWTASAGNMAQGVAWYARRLGILCTIVAPDTAPATKLAAIERLGARTILVSFDNWLHTFRTRTFPGLDGLFVHAFSDRAVMAGNGTIGLEIVSDLPDVDVVIMPYGGGGLSCGVAAAVKALRPGARAYAVEVDTAAPVAASFAAGKAVPFDFKPSFVDGMGAPFLFEEMWALVRKLLDGSLVVSLAETAEAVRLLMTRNRVVAEGAGAAAAAAALAGKAGSGKVVCVVSGGNIDDDKLVQILQGQVP